MSRKVCFLVSLLVVGVLLLISGFVLLGLYDTIIHDKIKQEINLKQGGDIYNNWVEPPVPIYFQIYVFNLENPQQFMNGGKPKVTQKGPYTYREHRKKGKIDYHVNDTVSYNEVRRFEFDRAMSVGSDDDNMTTINIPLVAIADIVRKEYPLIQELVELLLDWANESLVMDVTVNGILWGYEEPMIRKIKDLAQKLGHPLNISDRFGLFSGQNNTDDGRYTIFTGVEDVSRFGVIDRWNGLRNLSYWTTDQCNMINGTDGTIFPPFIDKSDILYLFSTDICRSIYVAYDEDVTLKDIPMYRFVAPRSVFQTQNNSANKGFCTPPDNCLPDGLLNAENCKSGAPVVFSQPNFLDADESVIKSVDGIKPVREDHQTYIDLDPNTGAALNVAKRLQVNILIQNVSFITPTKKLHKMYFPILWLNESAALTDKLADDFKKSVLTPMKILHGVEYGLIALGGLIVIMAILLLVFLKRKKKTELVDLTNEETKLVKD
ncbi:hypothetical protein CHS0354_028913 [Potamilus streckersoni]|uniref:Uncharacterized protein n=1 Tax=Potamilus streckersoni TaxID=2493646 RepID=A0AAE0SIW7_9BIVA|nr:hypothetical protein CHS0354_028913 [Potamilus streckersoni]